jgi:hypothetical protein
VLPIKHIKEPLGKGLEAHPTAFSMQHLGKHSGDEKPVYIKWRPNRNDKRF